MNDRVSGTPVSSYFRKTPTERLVHVRGIDKMCLFDLLLLQVSGNIVRIQIVVLVLC